MKVFVLDSEAAGLVGVFSSHSSIAKEVISNFDNNYGDWAEEAVYNIKRAVVDTEEFVTLMEQYGYYITEFEVV